METDTRTDFNTPLADLTACTWARHPVSSESTVRDNVLLIIIIVVVYLFFSSVGFRSEWKRQTPSPRPPGKYIIIFPRLHCRHGRLTGSASVVAGRQVLLLFTFHRRFHSSPVDKSNCTGIIRAYYVGRVPDVGVTVAFDCEHNNNYRCNNNNNEMHFEAARGTRHVAFVFRFVRENERKSCTRVKVNDWVGPVPDLGEYLGD